MTEQTALLRLMAWLSPVFPTGGFAYSSGLETAVQAGMIGDQQQMRQWLESNLSDGSLRNDAILLADSWRNHSSEPALAATAELALGLAGSKERYLEITAQGQAFASTITNWPELATLDLPAPCPLCVSVGAAAGFCGLNLSQTLVAYLHSVVTSQVQAAIRLSVLGQSGAAQILAQLEPVITTLAVEAETSTLDDLGSTAIAMEVMAMDHQYLEGRMFRS
ncbi:MAG: urease accessory UreF family protein [Rhizobiaceae bacterium]